MSNRKSSFASNASGSKLSTSWMIYVQLMLCMWTGGVAGWSYFYSDTTMDWRSARQWCRDHYTDMVAIQDQQEIAHLNRWLPRQPTYYWIGIRKVANVWTWVGTNKSLTDQATNWATGEPNNANDGQGDGINEDCVEMYIQRESEAGKWNDERCGKSKTALCYAAACKNDSCVQGECVETINSHKCQCFEGFYGDKCEHVVQCDSDEVVAPAKANVSCSHTHGAYAYGTLCDFSCEEGHRLSHPEPMRCTAAGSWSMAPTCEPVQCPVLPETDNMAVRCEGDTGGRFSYGSSCTFTCSRGYSLRGAHTTTCTATAAWSEAVPSCERVTCPMPQGDGRTTAHCSGPLDALQPGSTCSFTCEPGFEVQWAPVIACTEEGSWNASVPTCRVVTCDQGPAPEAHSIVRCSDTHGSVEYGAVCEYACEEGYHISDPSQNAVLCTAAGTWSPPPAVCERSAVQCSPPVAPESGQINCQPPLSVTASPSSYPQGSACTFTCNEGYEHQGPLTTECTQSGQWSSPPPTCTAMGCPVLDAPVDGTLNCTDSDQTHASQCSFACDQGFTLRGHRVVTCGLHGNWTAETPVCQAVPPSSHTEMVLAAGGAVSLSALSLAVWLMKRLRKKSSFASNASGSKLSTSWMIYFQLMLCMWTGGVAGWSYFYSNTTMDWRSARQWCRDHHTDMVAIQNQQEITHLNKWLHWQPTYYWIGIRKVDNVWTWVGTNKSLTDQATNWATGEPNNANDGQGDGINEDCVEMYIKRESQAGKWNDERCGKSKTALCYAAACKNDSCVQGECVETINSHKCQCSEGFYGDKCEHVVQCDSDEVVAPAKANVSCSHTHGAYAYGTLCDFSCEEGHRLSHPEPMRCTAAGSWSMAPTCEPECPVLPETDNMAVRCEGDTGGRFSYGSSCTFTCSRGYSLRGAHTTTCTVTAAWSEAVPSCERVTCPMPQGDGRTTAHCSGPLDALQPGSTCSFTCEPGFEVQWAPVIACTEEGSWNASVPTCRAVQCSPPVAPESGQINCQPPLSVTASPSSYPQGSACTFTCNEGYEHQGPLTTECTQSGQWSSPPPTCTAMGCPVLDAPVDGALNCTDSDQTHASQCSFACDQGFTLRGHRVVTCGLHGNWTAETPVCQAVPPSSHTEMVLAAGGAVSLSALSLAVWLMKRLRKLTARKFSLTSNSDAEDPPQHYKNSIDGLI
ncbi:E-selectin [Merluccius polli]|uniref:E-selectin n=1 Tax=Merluccius polli TaxID=89951 RepID=A0AA47P1Y8_MERPO|nr:E-selectin [Merluccius polli]